MNKKDIKIIDGMFNLHINKMLPNNKEDLKALLKACDEKLQKFKTDI